MDTPTQKHVDELERAVSELSVLNEIATAINVSMSVDAIARTILERCIRQLKASQGAIFLLSDEGESAGEFKTFVRAKGTSPEGLSLHLDEFLKGWMIRNRKTLVCNSPDSDPRFGDANQDGTGISSILAAPLLEHRRLTGLLVIFNKADDAGFSQQDERFLAIVGSQVAIVLENARLFEREARHVTQVQQRRMEAMTRLVAGIAHELNNPVGAALGSIQSLVRAAEALGEAVRETVETGSDHERKVQSITEVLKQSADVVGRASARVAGVVDRLRKFVHLDQAELQLVSIHDSLDNCVAMLNPQLGQRITVYKEYGEVPEIKCFPAQLNQVFYNVVLNAIEAIADQGTIVLKTSAANGMIHIAVRDSGAGISPGNLERIIEPGFTTKGVGVGTGLGLAICYQVVQAHRGDLSVTSEEGRGTQVVISLPIDFETLEAWGERERS